MFSDFMKLSALIFMSTVSAAALAQNAPASEAAPQAAEADGGLEDIIVTARKREENLQKAPAAIMAVAGDTLSTRVITSAIELTKVLPNAALREQGPVAQSTIRGVGSRLDFPNVSPTVAFTYNGIIIPRYGTGGILFDVGSVQQIAGPQGTLYGGSAAAGAINILTARPTDDFSGRVSVGGGNYSTVLIDGNQNFTLSDKLSLRAAVTYNRHDGYQGQGLDSSNRIQGRISLLARPTDDLTALIFFSGSRTGGKVGAAATPYTRPLPSDPWAVPATGPRGNPITSKDVYARYRTYVVGANIDWRVGAGTFTYIPGYVHVQSNYKFYLAGYNNLLDVFDTENQVSQELRYSVELDKLKLSAGVFWMQNKTDFSDNIYVGVLPAAQGYYLRVPVNSTNQKNISYSAFTQLTYSLNDALRLTAGGRVSVDKIKATGRGRNNVPFSFDKRSSRPDWKVGADYDLAERVLVYANVQTGYVPFGYDPDSGTPTRVIPEAKLLAYSGGFKSRLLDNRLEINNEIFYYNYKNFQAYVFNNSTGSSILFNARKSRIYGTDLNVRWHVAENTSLDAGVVVQSAVHTVFSGPGYNFSGNRLANAPKLVVNVNLELRAAVQKPTTVAAG